MFNLYYLISRNEPSNPLFEIPSSDDVKTEAEQIIKDLNLTIPLNIFIQEYPIRHGSSYTPRGNEVVIVLQEQADPQYGANWRYILAHELMHAQQFADGRLEQGYGSYFMPYFRWKGEDIPYRPSSQEEHMAFPWEQEANEYARSYMRRFHSDVQEVI